VVVFKIGRARVTEWGKQKCKKGGAPSFPQNSKTIVADHQQLSSAICAVAISSTHANQIVR
jgi:hypothetical protein